jgi:hypothetical protein
MCEPTQPISPVISIINSSISATIIRSLRTRTSPILSNLPLHPAEKSTHLKPTSEDQGENTRVGRNTDDRFTYSFSSSNSALNTMRHVFVLSRWSDILILVFALQIGHDQQYEEDGIYLRWGININQLHSNETPNHEVRYIGAV